MNSKISLNRVYLLSALYILKIGHADYKFNYFCLFSPPRLEKSVRKHFQFEKGWVGGGGERERSIPLYTLTRAF